MEGFLTDRPLVSAIVATYNRAYIVCEAIDSILGQTYPNIEIIVVDDGSTDDTDTKLARYDHRIQYIYQRNGGPAAAWNTGIRNSRGSLISFLGSDDLWLPTFIEKAVQGFRTVDACVGCVFADCQSQIGTYRIPSLVNKCKMFSKLVAGESNPCELQIFSQKSIYRCLLAEMPVKQQAAVFKADRVQQTGPFLSSWMSGEDWEFILRFARSSSFAYLGKPLVVMRTQADSTFGRYRTQDARNLLTRLIEEKRLLADSVLRQAARQGIAHHANQLAWQYFHEGSHDLARQTYLRGLTESWRFSLLARCVATYLPQSIRSSVKRIKNKTHGY